MTKSICVCFHKYTPYGEQYYEPILDFFMSNMAKYQDEFDMLYLIDSTWKIQSIKESWGITKVKVIKVNPHLRYYDAYKEILPQIKEDLVLFMDNDMVVYKLGIIKKTFDLVYDSVFHYEGEYDVVSIYDTIGEYKTDKLNGKNKFCPYWFATRTELLKKYDFLDWGLDMPFCETFGHLTEFMLANGVKSYEWEEDKSNIYFDGTKTNKKGKDLGYYHIRAGSTPAVLLSWKDYQPEEYWKYLKEQPRNEYLRQIAWYWWMCFITGNADCMEVLGEVTRDLEISDKDWYNYIQNFLNYHGLFYNNGWDTETNQPVYVHAE